MTPPITIDFDDEPDVPKTVTEKDGETGRGGRGGGDSRGHTQGKGKGGNKKFKSTLPTPFPTMPSPFR